jgi:hypothetical protein
VPRAFAIFYLGGRICTKLGICPYYNTFQYEWPTYILIWETTGKKGLTLGDPVTIYILIPAHPLHSEVDFSHISYGDHPLCFYSYSYSCSC